MQANQSQLIKLWPLRPHQMTRMNLQKTKKSGKIETKWWYSKKSGNIPARSPLQLLGSRLLHLFPTEKSTPQTFFRPPIFSLSIRIPSPSLLCLLSDDPLMPSPPFFSFPLRFVSASQTKYAKENLLSFLLFPFLFRKSECSFRISYFHMYVATLIPFSLTKYFSYLFECTYLSEIWIVAPILLPNNKKKNENRENKK